MPHSMPVSSGCTRHVHTFALRYTSAYMEARPFPDTLLANRLWHLLSDYRLAYVLCVMGATLGPKLPDFAEHPVYLPRHSSRLVRRNGNSPSEN